MRTRFTALLFLLAASTLTLTGCIAGITYNVSGPPPATFLFTTATASNTAGTIDTYPVASTGSAVAASSAVPITGTYVGGIHGDREGNIYLVSAPYNTNNLTVSVYSTAAGVLTLTRSFTYSTPVYSFAVDPTGIVYVSKGRGVILVFPANSSGAATPTTIAVSTPSYSAMATDSAGNLFAYDTSGIITVFQAGTYTHSQYIGPTSNLNYASVTDMALDSAGNIYIAGTAGSTPTIFEYPQTYGTVAAIRTFSGSNTLFGPLQALAVDNAGNIYVEDAASTINPHNVDLYSFAATTATGNLNIAPTNHFTPATPSSGTAGSVGLVAY